MRVTNVLSALSSERFSPSVISENAASRTFSSATSSSISVNAASGDAS
jgi:hypothetical protein